MSDAWRALATTFHLVSAADVAAAPRFERYQDWRAHVHWFSPDEPPLCVLFVSHRWERPDEPDPTGRQLRALQRFLELVARCTAACFVAREQRAAQLPLLDIEGSLQALVVALRILDLDPLGQSFVPGPARRSEVTAKAAELGPGAFAAWLASRIAVWIDYACVPQSPRSEGEARELNETLRRLPELMRASMLLALRHDGDDYAASGWCTAESFLGGLGGFARNLFVDVDRLLAGAALYMPGSVLTASRVGSDEERVMGESYALDLRGFTDDRTRLLGAQQPLVTSAPPRLWSSYISLLSSSFQPTMSDPRPTRRVLELILHLGEALVQRWLFAEQTIELDLRDLVVDQFARVGLRCTVREDITYLGLLVMSEGKLHAMQPMLRAAVAAWTTEPGGRPLRVRLHPLAPTTRALLYQVKPASPGTWQSRLTTGATGNDERKVVDQLQEHLAAQPLRFEFV
jgi:hypothetical protein